MRNYQTTALKMNLEQKSYYEGIINNINERIQHTKNQMNVFDEESKNQINFGLISDGWHTFDELYEYRLLYNAALFNAWYKNENRYFDVHKSKRHYDGEECFGGGWFIVVAMLPTGQITNHYELKDWDLFNIPETEKALYEFDGHTPQEAAKRLKDYLLRRY